MNIYIVLLQFSIRFHDADDGACYAGDGQRILLVYSSKDKAETLVKEWNPVFAAAGKETTIFPVQRHNSQIKKEFGFTLDNIDDGYDFRLAVEECELDEADNL